MFDNGKLWAGLQEQEDGVFNVLLHACPLDVFPT